MPTGNGSGDARGKLAGVFAFWRLAWMVKTQTRGVSCRAIVSGRPAAVQDQSPNLNVQGISGPPASNISIGWKIAKLAVWAKLPFA